MKKALLVILVSICSLSGSAQMKFDQSTFDTLPDREAKVAQQAQAEVAKSRLPHRLSLSYFDCLWIVDTYRTVIKLTDIMSNTDQSKVNCIGAIDLGYHFMSKNQRWSYGVDLSFSTINVLSPQLNTVISTDVTIIGIMPTVTCYYIKKGIVRLYGSMSLGLTVLNYNTVTLPVIAFQFNPIGIRVGTNRVAGFFSLGVGVSGLCNVGVQVGL